MTKRLNKLTASVGVSAALLIGCGPKTAESGPTFPGVNAAEQGEQSKGFDRIRGIAESIPENNDQASGLGYGMLVACGVITIDESNELVGSLGFGQDRLGQIYIGLELGFDVINDGLVTCEELNAFRSRLDDQ